MKKANICDKIETLGGSKMEYYCGTDIIEVQRVKEALLGTNGFKEKIYTEVEILVGDSKGEKTKYEYYAGRFAAKEAIYKAISKIKDDFNFWEIEIVNDKNNKNRPVAHLKNNELLEMEKGGILEVDVSISHLSNYAIAMAIVKVNKA